MKTKKTLGWLAALGLAGSAFAFGACDQPRPECQTALPALGYAFATKYTLKRAPAAGCEAYVQAGDQVGLEFYHPPTDDKGTYNPDITTFAIQTASLGNETFFRQDAAGYAADREVACTGDPNPCLDNAEGHHPYAMGKFAAVTPDDNGLCTVEMPAADAAVMDFPAIPAVPEGMDPENEYAQDEIPAGSVKQEWSKVKIYVTAASPGTQFSADLKVTQDGCELEYSVVGVWPGIYCGGYDEYGSQTNEGPADDTVCDPCPPPGAAYGSGISPDFKTTCDPELFYCVLMDAKDPKKYASSIPQVLSTPADCGPVN